MPTRQLIHRSKRLVGTAYDVLRAAVPSKMRQAAMVRRQRDAVDQVLAELASTSVEAFGGSTLIDGMWDNPNYWLRFTLFRTAMGLANGHEVGLVGRWNARNCRRTLNVLNIQTIHRFGDLASPTRVFRRQAHRLLLDTSRPDDILEWSLPHEFSALMLYDGLLKRQRSARVDLSHPMIVDHVAEALWSLEAAERLLDTTRPDLLVLSHAIDFSYGSLAWLGAQRNLPVFVLSGMFGVARFWKVRRPKDIFDWMSRPTAADLDNMSESRAAALAEVGQQYLAKRRAGETTDIGGFYAYSKRSEVLSRQELVRRYGWDSEKPIVAVFASNWFDYPHHTGMRGFRDFLAWIETTVAAARANTSVNWLFRAHPIDEWYGGLTLRDCLPSQLPDHIRLLEERTSSAGTTDIADAIVTLHGSIGVEAAAMGKPVLVADRGWYHDCGFVKWADGPDAYFDMLQGAWWQDMDLARVASRAQVFAGWHYCCPSWQEDFLTGDDSEQSRLYQSLTALLSDSERAVYREIETIRVWIDSDHRMYHSYKIARADSYRVSNVRPAARRTMPSGRSIQCTTDQDA